MRAPAVVHGDSVQLGQAGAQGRGQGGDAFFDRGQAPFERVVHSRAEAEYGGVIAFPHLESLCGRIDDVLGGGGPLGRVQVEHRRFEAVAQARAHVQKAGAARAAQVLPAGGGQGVAADAFDVEVQLVSRLARVEQERDACLAGDGSDFLRGVHQAALRGDVGHRDELDVGVDAAAQVVDVELAGFVVVHDLDGRSGPPRDLEVGDGVAGVFGARGEDPVARSEGQRVEDRLPRARRVVAERDVVRGGVEQPRDRGVHAVEAVLGLLGRFVAAEQGFGAQIVDHGVGDARGRKGGAGVVEVRDSDAPRRFVPCAVDIERAGHMN